MRCKPATVFLPYSLYIIPSALSAEHTALIKLLVSLPDIIMIHIQLSFSGAGSNPSY